MVAGQPGGTRPGRRAKPADPRHDCARSGCAPHTCRPMSAATIRQIHAILSGAFATAVRWEWIDRNPAGTAKLPKARHRTAASPDPADVAKVIATARAVRPGPARAVPVAGCRHRGTPRRAVRVCSGRTWTCRDGVIRIAHQLPSAAGVPEMSARTPRHTRTAASRSTQSPAPVLAERRQAVSEATWAGSASTLPPTAYVFSRDLLGAAPWNPDWLTHKVAEIAQRRRESASTSRRCATTPASQLLAGGIDLRNTAARLGHGGGGATTLRHYADPVSEVDRRAAAYLAQLTAPAADGIAAPPSRHPRSYDPVEPFHCCLGYVVVRLLAPSRISGCRRRGGGRCRDADHAQLIIDRVHDPVVTDPDAPQPV